ncbi:uncharacterized protein LOC131253173 [Magnolia sinica]|uniref:uncharacterized protein LOC131253173 n=1 Tax=Magnolia sinica TaxID=86752 RepID=UPI002659385F|nr:uncharacterized protein LOC131253173 [Magnolia sinica]
MMVNAQVSDLKVSPHFGRGISKRTALLSFERAIFRALPSSERRNLPRQSSESLKNFLVPCRFISNSDYLFKLLRIGDSGVGKSRLLLRFAVRSLRILFFAPTLLILKNKG